MRKIETFYTGGGITLAEVDLSPDQYAVVSTEAPDFMAVYRYDDGEKTYLPEDMVASTQHHDLAPELKAIYKEMLEKLKKH